MGAGPGGAGRRARQEFPLEYVLGDFLQSKDYTRVYPLNECLGKVHLEILKGPAGSSKLFNRIDMKVKSYLHMNFL